MVVLGINQVTCLKKRACNLIKYTTIFILLPVLLNSGCKKEEPLIIYPDIITKPPIPSETDIGTSGGIIDYTGSVEILSRGIIWGDDPFLYFSTAIGYTMDGSGPGEYTSTLVHLDVNTLYYVRAYAETRNRILYGNVLQLILNRTPGAETKPATFISGFKATLHGTVISKNLSTTASFHFGQDTNQLDIISLGGYTNSGFAVFNVSYDIDSLKPDQTYYYRIAAENTVGINYGRFISFRTTKVVKDLDGNYYSILTIGDQTWLRENLRTTHFNNGDTILTPVRLGGSVYSPGSWAYGNDNFFAQEYGRLYNGFAVQDIRNLCPAGWHVPTKAEFNDLLSFVGGAGGANKLKEAGSSHWRDPNSGTNESEFTAVGGGYWSYLGFSKLQYEGSFWTYMGDYAITMTYNSSTVISSEKESAYGYSVRCIKGIIPRVKFLSVKDLTNSSATLCATVWPENVPTDIYFHYKSFAQGEQTTPAIQNPVNGSGPVIVSANIANLLPNTNYFLSIRVVCPDGNLIVYEGNFYTGQ
jgi:uncharacterized protein (TIGR02145 family)